MKRQIISGLLCAALALGCMPGAGAADAAASANAKQMGLSAVEKAVRENNAAVRSLQKTTAGLDTSSDISGAYSAQGSGLQAQITSYESLIESTENAMAALDDKSSSLYQTYEAQLRLLKSTLSQLEQSLAGLPGEAQASITQVDDMVYEMRRQTENVADQLAKGAQDLLISIKTLQTAQGGLERRLAALDRQLSVLEVKRECGMVSDYEVSSAQRTRDDLAANLDTLKNQCSDLSSSLALMCGYDADTLVVPSSLTSVSENDLRSMNHDADLESALKNSYSIWVKRNALRNAQNQQDDNISGTDSAVRAAEQALDAERESVENAFENAYRTVQDCQTSWKAAQTASAQAQRELETAGVKYQNGMISRMAYLDAQDARADAEADEETARLKLISAYKQYQWAVQGVVSSAS